MYTVVILVLIPGNVFVHIQKINSELPVEKNLF